MKPQEQRYIVTVGADRTAVQVELTFDLAGDRWVAAVDGERVALRLDALAADGTVREEVDGRPLELVLNGDGGLALADGEALAVRARTPGEIVLAAARPQPPAGAADKDEVTCPITGEVLAVLVAAGERVSVDQPLVRVEAMKMETLVRSPADATVARVDVAAGDRVRAGAALIELAPTSEHRPNPGPDPDPDAAFMDADRVGTGRDQDQDSRRT